ncbi:hypothetical protein T484DRAFT_2114884 [Baffinella frigidus]|nr:hypothetical protein T484DRAFT_2114884 [Cryptophyta sp. CCMP2293]
MMRVVCGRILHLINPQPSTLNPQPSTLNPQLATLNPQPSTCNPKQGAGAALERLTTQLAGTSEASGNPLTTGELPDNGSSPDSGLRGEACAAVRALSALLKRKAPALLSSP